ESYPQLLRHRTCARFLGPRRTGGICAPQNRRVLDLWLFRKLRENPTAIFFHNHYIFNPRTADSWIIQTRLDGETLSRFQGHLLQARIFMNFEPEAVAGPVKKPDTAPITHFRWEAPPIE